MYAQDAVVLVLQPYQRNRKDVWKQYSYRSLFHRAFKKYQYFFPKEQIVKEFSKLLGTDNFFFKGYHDFIDTKPRQFILNFSKKSSISYFKTQRLIEKSNSFITSDRLDCVEDAQYASYDIYISYKKHDEVFVEPIQHIVLREIRYCHNLTKIVSSYCLPYIEDRSYNFMRPYGWIKI